jgi:hypothetical protein
MAIVQRWSPTEAVERVASIQFLKMDRKPAIEAGSARPAAMFHDMKEKLGIRLKM